MSLSTLPAAEATCPHCQHANRTLAKFCGACGGSLWEPCAKCEQTNAFGLAFCDHCGVNLPAARASLQTLVDENWQRAQTLREQGRYVDALSRLAAVARFTHPAVQPLATEAKTLLPIWEGELVEAQTRAASVTDEGRRLLLACDYAAALEAVQSVPDELRSDALRQLAAEVEEKHEEVRQLEARVTQCVSDKLYADALAAIDRLLVLRPQRAEPRPLATKLVAHFAQSGRKRIGTQQYEEALLVLSKVPPALRTPELAQLHDEATEFVFLLANLRAAPVIDASLEAFAERLLEMAPENIPVARLLAQLRLRRQKAGENAAATELVWTSPPQRTALGLPVEHWAGWRRLDDRAIRQSPLVARRPDHFAVACGLALQGLGLAAIDINLLPAPTTRGMFGGLKNLKSLGKLSRGGRKGPQSAWGIELSPTGLKAVKLVAEGELLQGRFDQCDLVEHGKILSLPGIESERPALLAETLRVFLSRNDLKGARVCLNFPGTKVLARFLTLPPVPTDRIDETMRLETPHQVALPLDELEWDYALQPVVPEKATTGHDVILLAAKRPYVADWLAPFKNAGIHVDVLQHEAVALHNLLAYERDDLSRKGDAASTCAVALLDLGCDASNLLVSSPNFAWFRTLPLGGSDFSRALVRAFNLTYAQAEQVKREPTRAKRVSRLYSALYPVFDELLSETQRSLGSFTNRYRDLSLERLDLLGGASLQSGLWAYLRHGPLLKLPPITKTDK